MWLSGVIGSLIGSIVTIILHRMFFACGTLRIDQTNPEKDVYRIEINNLDRLAKKRRVTLKVDKNADLSRK